MSRLDLVIANARTHEKGEVSYKFFATQGMDGYTMCLDLGLTGSIHRYARYSMGKMLKEGCVCLG